MSAELSLLVLPGRDEEDGLPRLLDALAPSLATSRPTVHVLLPRGTAEELGLPRPCRPLEHRCEAGSPALAEALTRLDDELVVLVSADALPAPGWLEALVATARAHPGAAFVASAIEMGFTPGLLHSAGIAWSPAGRARYRGFRRAVPDFAEEGPVLAPCRQACLLRRDALRRVGGLDGDFEELTGDAELGLRLLLHGLGGRVAPRARVAWLAPPPGLGEAVELRHKRQRDGAILLRSTYPIRLWGRRLPALARGRLVELLAAWRRHQLVPWAAGQLSAALDAKSHRRKKRLFTDPGLRFDLLESFVTDGRLPGSD